MIQTRVVDVVEEIFQCPGHVPEVGRRAEQVAVGVEHVGQRGRQGGPDNHIHPDDLRVTRAGQHGFEQFAGGR